MRNEPDLRLRLGEWTRCERVSVIRDHHDAMPGPDRDRPGMDRICVRLADGRVGVLDVWSSANQDIAAAPTDMELFAAEMNRWRARPENDDADAQRLTGT